MFGSTLHESVPTWVHAGCAPADAESIAVNANDTINQFRSMRVALSLVKSIHVVRVQIDRKIYPMRRNRRHSAVQGATKVIVVMPVRDTDPRCG